MGSLEDHKGFGALHAQFWMARTATGCDSVQLAVRWRSQGWWPV